MNFIIDNCSVVSEISGDCSIQKRGSIEFIDDGIKFRNFEFVTDEALTSDLDIYDSVMLAINKTIVEPLALSLAVNTKNLTH